MKVLVTGAQGQVGRELTCPIWPSTMTVHSVDRRSLDVGDAKQVSEAFAQFVPDLVVNAAAYTAVDRAEEEPEAAHHANVTGPATLAAACARQGAILVHLSTDYVFDGTKSTAWRERDPVRPLGVYGRSKAQGEAAVRERLDQHLILRVAWVHAAHGHNFVRTMLRVGAERDALKVVGDQVGGPTPAPDIAEAVAAIAQQMASGKARFGTYHLCGAPYVSWYGFAQAIFDEAQRYWGRRPSVTEITSDEWPTPVARPKNSTLDCSALMRDYGCAMPHWRVRLAEIVDRVLA